MTTFGGKIRNRGSPAFDASNYSRDQLELDFIKSREACNRMEMREERRLNDIAIRLFQSDSEDECEKSDSKRNKVASAKSKTIQILEFGQAMKKLIKFKNEYGHYYPRQTSEEFRQLARWCSRMRTKYADMKNGKPCNISKKNIKKLQEIGFMWNHTMTCQFCKETFFRVASFQYHMENKLCRIHKSQRESEVKGEFIVGGEVNKTTNLLSNDAGVHGTTSRTAKKTAIASNVSSKKEDLARQKNSMLDQQNKKIKKEIKTSASSNGSWGYNVTTPAAQQAFSNDESLEPTVGQSICPNCCKSYTALGLQYHLSNNVCQKN